MNVSYAKLCEIQVTPAQQMMLYRLIEDKYCLSRLVPCGCCFFTYKKSIIEKT